MNESYKRIDPVRVEMFKFVGLQLGNVAKSRVLISEVPVWWLVKNEDMPRQHSRQWGVLHRKVQWQATLWGEDPIGVRAHEDYSNDYESTRYFNRIDALVRRRRVLPRRTDGRRRWVWTHFAYPSGSAFHRQPRQEITQKEVPTGRSGLRI